ncbi:MAG: insulinase family protein [Chitinophagales bacterium]|nr:insulinase family protein [Chitinophagales bacterium]
MKLLQLLLCVSLLSTGAFAISGDELPENFHYSKLNNGLELLVIEDNSVPLATIEICVRNGSFTEDPEYDGLSHLYEHMFFKANKDLPSQEQFMAKVSELGIAFNGTTSSERVNYFVTLSSSKVNQGLNFMNSAIRYPLFLEEEMKKENPVVDGEFQRMESNPMSMLYQHASKLLWGKHFSRKNPIGDHDIILSATAEKMRTIQSKYYYPDNSILVVAGDVNHDLIREKANSIFGDWKPAGFDPIAKWPIPEFDPIEEDIYSVFINENARTPIYMVTMHGPDTRNDVKGTYAADVFSYILSQKSSKLQENLVDAGLALDVSVGYQTCKYTGPIYITLVPRPDKVKEAYTALMNEVNLWDSEDYFTVDQLKTAQNMLAIQDAYGKEKTSSFVHTVTYWWASASIDYYTSYVDEIKKLTKDDIREYVKTYIKGKNKVTTLMLTSEMQNSMGITNLEDYLKIKE